MSGKIPAIGIDLGTTFSCVAVWQHGKVEIIPNEQGNRITPSYVAFTDTERLIGDAAKNQVVMNPENTVFDAKRLIGRKFDDPKIQDDIKLWPFKVINEGENPKIEVKFKNQKKRLTPEEISSMILSKMKEVAEAYLGGTVKDAVITVPAYFNDAQRQATKDAGTIAGLNVLRIINEPTVAALAYGLDKNLKGTKNVFVFDLGGGTFDVSIVTIYEGSQYDVRATAGDTHLGGEDFDNILVDYLVKEFKKKFSKDPSSSSKALRKLRTAAERAKRTLSSATEANIEVDALFEGIDFSTKISRARFEELCLNLFHSTIETSKQALKDATLEISSIDDIVLVGGSTRIPKIQSLLQSFFSGKTLNLSINPDEAVAYGAAVQAAILTGDQSSAIQRVLLIDVTPLSLGVEVHGGIMYVVVKRNTQTPCKLKRGLQTTRDNQTEMDILIFEGERTLTKDNNLLGKFTLSGVTPAPVGEAKVDVTYEVDDNGILVVTAEDRSSGNSKTITVKNDSGRLSKYEIDRLIRDSIRYKEEDNKEKARITARNELEIYLYKLKNLVSDDGNHLNENEKSLIKKHCAEDLEWLDSHSDANQSEFQQRLSKLKTQFSSLKTKIDQTL